MVGDQDVRDHHVMPRRAQAAANRAATRTEDGTTTVGQLRRRQGRKLFDEETQGKSVLKDVVAARNQMHQLASEVKEVPEIDQSARFGVGRPVDLLGWGLAELVDLLGPTAALVRATTDDR